MRSEDRKNLERIFPGVPLWIAVALEKLSSELIKVVAYVPECARLCERGTEKEGERAGAEGQRKGGSNWILLV